MKNSLKRDGYWMRRALKIARKGEGLTRPNPPVGAVVVKGAAMVGAGYHARAGGPHAEVTALTVAGTRARGATLYVTLEPCSTHGRTPPCADAIIEAGITRVVAAVKDPNPANSGRGFEKLKTAGIEVTEGVNEKEATDLIAPFRKWIETGLPYITLKMAMTLDGRIADQTGRSKWISCDKSRSHVAKLRARADAIMVGAGTALADDPSLLAGHGKDARKPYRIIVDDNGMSPPNARALTDDNAKCTIMAITSKCPEDRRRQYAKNGSSVWTIRGTSRGVSVTDLSRRLGKSGFLHVICEGGGELARSLLGSDLVDEYLFFIAPKILGGGQSKPVIAGPPWNLGKGPELEFTLVKKSGRDIMLRAVPSKQ